MGLMENGGIMKNLLFIMLKYSRKRVPAFSISVQENLRSTKHVDQTSNKKYE